MLKKLKLYFRHLTFRLEIRGIMAKKSAINRNEKRVKMVKSASNKRAKLKAIIMDKNKTIEERFEASMKLAEVPRNSAKIRIRNRCGLTGRPRGYYRKFNLSRIALRELGSQGVIPGLIKSSW
jgi:small subunit ribosomal protein S14